MNGLRLIAQSRLNPEGLRRISIQSTLRLLGRPAPGSTDQSGASSCLRRQAHLRKRSISRQASFSFAMSAKADEVSKGLVTVQWLQQRLKDPEIKILDGSWYMPNAGRDPAAEFSKERIPGSKFFDVDNISDTTSSLPHMLPTPASFAAAADYLGVTNSSTVVIYDRAGIFSAPRVWWTFKAFGHERVAVLDGGYPAWQAAGSEIDQSSVSLEEVAGSGKAAKSPPASLKYQPKKQDELVRSVSQVIENVDSKKEDVVDARGAARFEGSAPEPRKGIRGGHIPGSLNVPFDSVIADGRFKGKEELLKAFTASGLKLDKPVVTSCGTGVTASVLALGLNIIDPEYSVAVYDGSWTEWGGREDTPIATGK